MRLTYDTRLVHFSMHAAGTMHMVGVCVCVCVCVVIILGT